MVSRKIRVEEKRNDKFRNYELPIAKAKGIAKNSFMTGFLVGINWAVKERVIELITKEESFKY